MKQYPTTQRSRLRRSGAARYDMPVRHVGGLRRVHVCVLVMSRKVVRSERDAVQHPTCPRLAFNVRGTAVVKSQRRKGQRGHDITPASHRVDARAREIRHRRLPGCSVLKEPRGHAVRTRKGGKWIAARGIDDDDTTTGWPLTSM